MFRGRERETEIYARGNSGRGKRRLALTDVFKKWRYKLTWERVGIMETSVNQEVGVDQAVAALPSVRRGKQTLSK